MNEEKRKRKRKDKKKVKKEVSKTSQEPIREQKEFYTNEIENSDKESVNLEELSLEELEEMQKKLEVDGKEARRRGDKKAEEAAAKEKVFSLCIDGLGPTQIAK